MSPDSTTPSNTVLTNLSRSGRLLRHRYLSNPFAHRRRMATGMGRWKIRLADTGPS